MITLYIWLGVMVVTLCTAVVMLVFGYQKNALCRKIVSVGVIAALSLGFIFAITGGVMSNSTDKLCDQYHDLTLYQYTIEQSVNEYVRFDYYNRVMDYNEMYENHRCQAANDWFGWLYGKDWDSGIGYIEFVLHGDEYYE